MVRPVIDTMNVRYVLEKLATAGLARDYFLWMPHKYLMDWPWLVRTAIYPMDMSVLVTLPYFLWMASNYLMNCPGLVRPFISPKDAK